VDVLYNKNNAIILYLKMQRFLTIRIPWSFAVEMLPLIVKFTSASENAPVERRRKGA